MSVTQLSVFLGNTTGRLAEVTKVLGEEGVNIRGFCIADTRDFGVLRLILDHEEKAVNALRAKDFTVHEEEVVLVRVPDVPGGLTCALIGLVERGLNVEYAYAVVQSIIALGVRDIPATQAVLAAEGLPEVSPEVLVII